MARPELSRQSDVAFFALSPHAGLVSNLQSTLLHSVSQTPSPSIL